MRSHISPDVKTLIIGFFFRNNAGDDAFHYIYNDIFPKSPLIAYINPDDIDDIPTHVERIIMGGGDVINHYFLQRMEKIIFKSNFKGPVYGMSLGVPWPKVIEDGLIDRFTQLSVRHVEDMHRCKGRLGNDFVFYHHDLAHYLALKFSGNPSTKKSGNIFRIGVYLAQPYVNDNEHVINDIAYCIEQLPELLRSLDAISDHHRVEIHLIPFNTFVTNDKESDITINDNLKEKIHVNAKIINHTDTLNIADLWSLCGHMDFAVCQRYHAHLFSVMQNVPCVSLGVTAKVQKQLVDWGIPWCRCRIEMDERRRPLSIHYQYFKVTAETVWSNRASQNYRIDTVKDSFVKSWPEQREILKRWTSEDKDHIKRSSRPFPICSEKSEFLIMSSVTSTFKDIFPQWTKSFIDQFAEKILIKPVNFTKEIQSIEANIDSKFVYTFSSILLFYLINDISSCYNWGLAQKLIQNNDICLKKELEFVLYDDLKKRDFSTTPITNRPAKLTLPYDMTYLGKLKNSGVHRSGWDFVIQNLYRHINNHNDIIMDVYMDRTFGWASQAFTIIGLLPFKKSWVGWLHHPFLDDALDYSDNNSLKLFQCKTLQESLKFCKAIFVFGNDMKNRVQLELKKLGFDISVISFFHPTEQIHAEKRFSMDKFLKNPHKMIVQIGGWLRDCSAIYRLAVSSNIKINPLGLKKAALKGSQMDAYFPAKCQYKSSFCNLNKWQWCMDRATMSTLSQVKLINRLSNDQYDLLLDKNVIFLSLIECCAVNTVIEAIERNTPIFVNRLPSLEELLGKDYPGFYDDMGHATSMVTNVDVIERCHFHLAFKVKKDLIDVEYFLKSFMKVTAAYIL